MWHSQLPSTYFILQTCEKPRFINLTLSRVTIMRFLFYAGVTSLFLGANSESPDSKMMQAQMQGRPLYDSLLKLFFRSLHM